MAIQINDNGALRTLRVIQVNDNGTLRNVRRVQVNDNGTLRNIYLDAAGDVAIVNDLVSGGFSAARITYRSNGLMAYAGAATEGKNEWVTPTNATIASGYQIRFSGLTGDTNRIHAGSGPFNTWLDFSADRWVEIGVPPGPPPDISQAEFTVSIRDRFSGIVRGTANVQIISNLPF